MHEPYPPSGPTPPWQPDSTPPGPPPPYQAQPMHEYPGYPPTEQPPQYGQYPTPQAQYAPQQVQYPGAGAQGFPQPGPAAYQPPARARRRPRSRMALAAGLTLVFVILVGGGITAIAVGLPWQDDGSARSEVRLPATAGGLERIGPDGSLRGVQLTLYRSAPVTAKDIPGAQSDAYQDPGNPTTPVLVLGGEGSIDSPDDAVDTFLREYAKHVESDVADRGTVSPPSSLGGSMACGSITLQGSGYGICAWANPSALVATLCARRPAADAGTVTKRMLPDIVRRPAD